MAITEEKFRALGGKVGLFLKLFIRFLQFVLGVTIAGVYGNEWANAAKYKGGYDPAWGYATIVGGLSALTAIIYHIPRVKAFCFFFIDLLYVLMFSIVIAIFGQAYLSKTFPVKISKSVVVAGPNIQRMKATVWIDVIAGVLWLVTGVHSLISWFRVKSELKKRRAVA
jgi:hypothetical protein